MGVYPKVGNLAGWISPDTWGRDQTRCVGIMKQKHQQELLITKQVKQFGNEIAHSQQALIYAIGSFFRYPDLEIAKTEIWYLRPWNYLEQVYTRDEAMVFMPKLHERAIAMTTATNFPPNPSTYNCKWCSYGKGEQNPICEWAESCYNKTYSINE